MADDQQTRAAPLRRYRRQANRLVEPEESKALREGNDERLRKLNDLRSQPPLPPRSLRGLMNWFLTHL